jgi:hypothetical protein
MRREGRVVSGGEDVTRRRGSGCEARKVKQHNSDDALKEEGNGNGNGEW